MNKILIKEKQSFKYSLKKKFLNSRFLIIMIIPAIIFYAVFNYIPMYGILLAFSDLSLNKGIIGSIVPNWVGFDNFVYIFTLDDGQLFWRVLGNTLIIGSIKIVISFLGAVIVALLINEIRMRFFKKAVQIIVTFPHFLSWVVVASLFILLFSNSGAVNHFIEQSGGDKINLFSDGNLFRVMLFSTDIWKEAGWSAIIYIATMAGISPDLYEAADIDGATRLQKIWHITLPGIKPTAILLLIMSVGGVLSAGFDQIYNMTSQLGNGLVMDSVEILDTLIYQGTQNDTGLLTRGEATALGLFKSVVGFMLVIITDRIAKACGERGII